MSTLTFSRRSAVERGRPVSSSSSGRTRRAAATLAPGPDFLLIDGNHCFPKSPWPYQTVVKGDAHSHTIAAASIVAKVTRDRLMHRLHEEFPAYGWRQNVGYPTQAHYAALAAHGPTPYHRRSFRLEPR